MALGLRYYVQVERPESLLAQFPYYALPFIAWYPFHHLGFWMRRSDPTLTIRRYVLMGLVCLFLLASFVEAWLLGAWGLTQLAASQIKASSFLMAAAVILFALASARRRMGGSWGLAWLGRNSYFIYLSHLLLLLPAARVLTRWDAVYSVQPLFWAILVATTTVACLVAVWIITRVVPQELAVGWLGIGRGRAQRLKDVKDTAEDLVTESSSGPAGF